MTNDRPLRDAEPETWLEKIEAVVSKLGEDDDILVINELVPGVRVSMGNEVDLNERVYDVPPAGSRVS